MRHNSVSLKRLTKITNRKSTLEIINEHAFTYNNMDLIDTETINTGTAYPSQQEDLKTYDYNNVNQLLNATGPNQTFTYDNDGNMTQGYTPAPENYAVTMTYDAENRLTSAEYTDSGSVLHRTEYSYSGNGMLAVLKKLENSVPVSEIHFIRAGFLPVQERDENNIVTREYTWGINMGGGGIGGLLNLKQNGNDYSYLYDGKGNVMAVLNSTQSIVASYRYDEFGNLMAKTGTLEQPFMFSTKRYDQSTGSSYYGYRFYSPCTGRWITRDPLGEDGGINLYGFVGNNAINFVDLWGLASVTTDMQNGTTTFDPRPEDPNGIPFTITTRNDVTSNSRPGAQDPFSTPDVNPINIDRSPAYGPTGAYLNTGDPRGRDIHGGGSGLLDPYAPRQGWVPTRGCTRGQNEDIQELNRRIRDFKRRHPGVAIPYTRR
jgi:RHS repeat-associated protein